MDSKLRDIILDTARLDFYVKRCVGFLIGYGCILLLVLTMIYLTRNL